MKDPLETVDFVDACQNYRLADTLDQLRVVKRFDELKHFIRDETKYLEMYKAIEEEIEFLNGLRAYLPITAKLDASRRMVQLQDILNELD